MKLPTPGGLQSKFVQVIMALMLFNFIMAGGTRLARVLLGDEWQLLKVFAPILVPIGIGIGLGILLKLGFTLLRASAWRWRR